jgi:hypothetical protein
LIEVRKVGFVLLHGLSVDFAVGIAGVAIRTQRDEIFEGVLLDPRPRHDVIDLDGECTTTRYSATVPSFDENVTSQLRWNSWPSIWHR